MNASVNVNPAELCAQDTLEVQINKQKLLVKQTVSDHRFRLGIAAIAFFSLSLKLNSIADDFKVLLASLITVITIWAVVEFKKQWSAKRVITEFDEMTKQVEHCLTTPDLQDARKLESRLLSMINSEKRCLLSLYAQSHIAKVIRHVKKLEVEVYKAGLKQSYELSLLNLTVEHYRRLDKHPLNQVKNKLNTAFKKLTARRNELQARWDVTYDNLSWWNKMKYADGPNFSELDADISKLKAMNTKFDLKHRDDLGNLNKVYLSKNATALKRLEADYKSASNFINQHYALTGATPTVDKNGLLKAAGWAGAFGLSYSMWDDFMTTHQVYDALRSVNGNFEGMSDSEVWVETLWMSESSLVGLASLTKGAYFEQLVANDTQGELFEHFNHPDTDITIDGIAYQLKATDSVSYVNSVEEGIPVIATTEVAEATGAIDSGFTNAELSADVDTAINGIGFDVSDTLADGIFTGLGGLGIFASLNGINHAVERYEKGTDGEQAIFEGIGVAIEGTAKAMVDAGEMVYNAAMSRPSRAVGRGIIKVFKKLDEKFEAAEKADKAKINR